MSTIETYMMEVTPLTLDEVAEDVGVTHETLSGLYESHKSRELYQKIYAVVTINGGLTPSWTLLSERQINKRYRVAK